MDVTTVPNQTPPRRGFRIIDGQRLHPPFKIVKTTSPFRFLDLPRELRDKIYFYALVSSASLEFKSEGRSKLFCVPGLHRIALSERPAISLLKVCRATWMEGSEMFYKHTVFEFRAQWPRAQAFDVFLEVVPAANLAMVRHIRLQTTRGWARKAISRVNGETIESKEKPKTERIQKYKLTGLRTLELCYAEWVEEFYEDDGIGAEIDPGFICTSSSSLVPGDIYVFRHREGGERREDDAIDGFWLERRE